MAFRYRYIRFFISSTFADMTPERDVIASIMSRLNEEYSQSGWSIDYIDLRWGVSKESSAGNNTMRICLEELRRCKKLSPRPNFLFLIGDRYGWIPLPEIIYPNEWERILELADESEKASLRLAYRIDLNYLPEGRYLLQPIDCKDASRRLDRLFDRLYKGSRLSATELEIAEGALQVKDAKDHVVGYLRRLKSVPEDVSSTYQDDDPEMAHALTRLKDKLKSLLPEENILHSGEIDFSTYSSENYIRWFEEEMEKRIRRVIDREIEAHTVPQSDYLHDYYLDIAKKNSEYFYGRENELSQLLSFVNSDGYKYPFVIFGEPGLGKTSFVSKGIMAIMQQPGCVVVPRFIGSGDGIFSLNDLIVSIFNDLHKYFSQEGLERYPHLIDIYEADNIKQFDFEETWFHLLDRLLLPGKYVIIIDAMDVIASSKDCTSLYNSLVMGPIINPYSTEDKEVYNMFEKLRIIVSIAHDGDKPMLYEWDRYQHLRLQTFLQESKCNFVKGLLATKGKTISQDQNKALYDILFDSDSRGIYLDMIGKYFSSLPSYAIIEKIPGDFAGAAKKILDSLIKTGIHHRNLVKKFLAVVAYSPDGVDINTLNSILACDDGLIDEILNDSFHQFDSTGEERQLPPILLSRLYSDLDGIFITTRPSVIGNAIVIRHQEILKMVKDWLGPEMMRTAKTLQYLYFRNAWKKGNRFAINSVARLICEMREGEEGACELASVLCNIDYLAERVNLPRKKELMEDYDSLILMSEGADYLRQQIPLLRKFAALLRYLPERVERNVFLAWCRNIPIENFINKRLIAESPDYIMADQLRMFDFSKSIIGINQRKEFFNQFEPPHFALRYSYRVEYREDLSELVRIDEADRSEEVVIRVSHGKGKCCLHPFASHNLLVIVYPDSVSCIDLTSGEKIFENVFNCQISLYDMAVSVSPQGRFVTVDADYCDTEGWTMNILLVIDLSGINPCISIPKGDSLRFSRSEKYLWATYSRGVITRWDISTSQGIEIPYQDLQFSSERCVYNRFDILDALDDNVVIVGAFTFHGRLQHNHIHLKIKERSYKYWGLPTIGHFSKDESSIFVLNACLDILSLDEKRDVRQYPISATDIADLSDKVVLGIKGERFLYGSNPVYDLNTCISENSHYFPINKRLDCSGFSVSRDGLTVCVSNFQYILKESIVIYKYGREKGWYKIFLHPELTEPIIGVYATCVSPSGEEVACACGGGGKTWIKKIRISDNCILSEIPVPYPITTLKFSSDGNVLIAADAPNRTTPWAPTHTPKFRIIKYNSGDCSHPVILERNIPLSDGKETVIGYNGFELLPDDRHVMFSGLIFDLHEDKVLRDNPLPTSDFYYHKYGDTPDRKEIRVFTSGGLVISAGRGNLYLFDIIKQLTIEAEWKDTPIAISPDGCWVIMRTPECHLYRIDLALIYKKSLKDKFPQNVINVLFHPLRKAFYAITRDSGIYFCNMEGDILAYAMAVEIIDAKVTDKGLVVVKDGLQVSLFAPSPSIVSSLQFWEMDDSIITHLFRQKYFNRH